jgi:hypothetical protein
MKNQRKLSLMVLAAAALTIAGFNLAPAQTAARAPGSPVPITPHPVPTTPSPAPLTPNPLPTQSQANTTTGNNGGSQALPPSSGYAGASTNNGAAPGPAPAR